MRTVNFSIEEIWENSSGGFCDSDYHHPWNVEVICTACCRSKRLRTIWIYEYCLESTLLAKSKQSPSDCCTDTDSHEHHSLYHSHSRTLLWAIRLYTKYSVPTLTIDVLILLSTLLVLAKINSYLVPKIYADMRVWTWSESISVNECDLIQNSDEMSEIER